MKLGYLMIPRQCGGKAPAHDFGRMELAHELGFSEFYNVCDDDALTANTHGSDIGPEFAPALRTLPDLPERPIPHVVAIDGKRQAPIEVAGKSNAARPSATTAQVAANARQMHATLSVSWLSKTELAQHWAAHVTGSTHAGLRARPENWRIARTIIVCDDAARAEAAVKSDDSPCRAYYAKMAQPEADRAEVDALIEDCVLYGPLDRVLDQLKEISATSGPFGTLTVVDHDWPDTDLAQRSLEYLAAVLAPVTTRSRAAN